MEASIRHERQFPMTAALGVSVGLHVVLALLAWWLPLLRPPAAAEIPDDTVLKFTFAQSTGQEEEGPEGDVPFETPEPRRTANPQPPANPGAEPSPPLDPSPEQRAIVDPGEAERERSEEQDRPSPEEAAELATPDFPEQADAELLREPAPETSPDEAEAAAPASSFDLDRALRDYGQALDQARAASPPPPPPGSGPPRNVYVPDPSDFATTGYGMGNLVFETRDFDWSDYARSIYIAIWRAWHNRLLRMVNEFEKWSYVNRQPYLNHTSQIRFVIERSGEVTGILIEGPSGCVPLDQSAAQALAEVLLPALPEAFPKDREVVHARFIATGEVRNMRPHLTRLKALNYF